MGYFLGALGEGIPVPLDRIGDFAFGVFNTEGFFSCTGSGVFRGSFVGREVLCVSSSLWLVFTTVVSSIDPGSEGVVATFPMVCVSVTVTVRWVVSTSLSTGVTDDSPVELDSVSLHPKGRRSIINNISFILVASKNVRMRFVQSSCAALCASFPSAAAFTMSLQRIYLRAKKETGFRDSTWTERAPFPVSMDACGTCDLLELWSERAPGK